MAMPTVSKPLTVALTGLAESKAEWSSRPRQDRMNSRVCNRYASESSKLSHREQLSPSTSAHSVRCIISANAIVRPSLAGTYRRPKQTTKIYRIYQLSNPSTVERRTHPSDVEGEGLQPVVPRSRPPRCAKVSQVGRFETFKLGAMAHCADGIRNINTMCVGDFSVRGLVLYLSSHSSTSRRSWSRPGLTSFGQS